MPRITSILKNGSSLFLSLCLIVQLLSYLSDFLFNSFNLNTNSFFGVILSLFISIKNTVIENWIPFSIFFIFVVLSSSLYNILSSKQNCLKETTTINILLAISNILCCINFFNTDSLKEKLSLITNNAVEIILFFIGLFICVILIILFKQINSANRAKNEIHSYIQESLNNSNIGNIRSDQNVSGTEENLQVDEGNSQVDYENSQTVQENSNRTLQPSNEILKHPFAYMYETYKYNFAKKRVDESNTRLNNHSNNGSSNSILFSFWGTVSFLISTIGIVALIVFIIKNKNNTGFRTFCNNLIEGLSNFSNSINTMNNPIMDFILSIGTLVLLAVGFVLIVFLFHFFLQTYVYILINSKEDSNSVVRFARGLKTFFFSTADSAIDLLLFIPDFLETVRESLLDNEPDTLIDTRYPQKKKPPEDRNSNQP